MHPDRVTEAQELLNRWTANPSLAERHPLYTGYLRSLASAERLNAVHRYLRPLVAQLKADTHARRIELVHTLCSAVEYTNRIAGSSPVPGMPHELLEEIAIPTLLAQRAQHPEDAYAHLWLAMLPSRKLIPGLPERRELLELAQSLAPTDSLVLECIARERLHSIWFSCHHLPEALLSPEQAVRDEIEHLRTLASLVRAECSASFLAEALRYEEQINHFVHARGSANAA
jgi:hypothetical protein